MIADALQRKVEEILQRMRADGPRMQSRDAGYVVDANAVDGWADELDAALAVLRTERGEEPLTFQVFSQMNRERCESPNGFNHALGSWDTSDWFLAVLGELGEAANVAKKLNRVRDGIPGNKETPDELRTKLRKEIGDAFVYLDLLAQAHDFTIVDAALEVFHAKSIEIGYEVEAESRTERGAQEEPKNYDVYSAEVERDLSINYEAVRAPHPERTEPK